MNVQNSVLQLQNNTNQVQYENGRETLGTGEINKNSFLTLLMAQLQHQDPMDPVENSEFIQQQASFTQIEKLDQLIDVTTSSNVLGEASSLVGQNVEVRLDGGQTRSGRVDSVQFGSNGIGIHVGDSVYTMDQVVGIFANEPSI